MMKHTMVTVIRGVSTNEDCDAVRLARETKIADVDIALALVIRLNESGREEMAGWLYGALAAPLGLMEPDGPTPGALGRVAHGAAFVCETLASMLRAGARTRAK